MPRRVPLTEAQRSAKIEGDRRRRREKKAEVATLRNENTRLTEENERLNDMVLNLQNTVHQQGELIQQLQHQTNQEQEETKNLSNEITRLSDMVQSLQNTVHKQCELIGQLQHQKNLEEEEEEEETKKIGKKGLGFLQNKVRELQGLVATQSNEITRLSDMVPSLQNTVHQQHELIRKLQHQKNLEEEETRMLVDSFFDIDKFPSPIKEEAAAAANYESIAGGPSSHISSERLIRELEKPNPREEAERQRKGKAIQNHFSN